LSATAQLTAADGRQGLYDDELLGRLLWIRHFELALLDLFAQGQVSGTVHTCIGQEYIPVALSPLIRDDMVFSNHRGHGHYLALHDDAEGLLAEVLGRQGAVCHGVGGSQHIYRDGRYLSTGVQGEGVAVAAGVALHEARARSGRLAVAFTGDGTWGEGTVYEALNMAALWGLPLVLVVENNGIAQTTPTALGMAGSIGGRAAAFGIPHLLVHESDVLRIRRLVAPSLERARQAPEPLILEFCTERVGPHSKGDDTRPAEELAGIRERDWATRYRASHARQFERVDAAARRRIADLVADVTQRPLSAWPRGANG
jgi:TPP-dependent pyruvate/acetoin dehydrogenase alpha subunit